ncbi:MULTISPECIES: gliding motility protein GldL [Chryseobacterium]|jgi:gliding motility-associated protein GldL|uniref:Gliding motility protein GldL n=3 Tax=Chryseobacterium TaxID=59732 RepID=A0ABX9IFZ3_9FLAO|nr:MULTISPECIES: gliding motility protein GldL [Chryseobacterium]MBL3548409.1 gliding motility protein GldL [Chryseobacterium sp. KMC2]MDC8101529.1 gliding motility protein GldL [Chryseobacterium rhizosphaerae]MDR6544164.1 gliding motility-associated protein GldL [Chryseobacterium rhizosphaerae]PWN64945.1 gliding motility protein GldL [Chryseobacterium phosphatilyticum]REC72367.1 gliding motility protein GldL [Chryseobacterium rhizosphaerae]
MFKTKDAWMNFFYSFGAAIVILGAWLKITHITLGPINGNIALTVGLITEAIIFIIFAFDPPKSEESYAWENVYPELLDKHANPNPLHSNVSSRNNNAAAQFAELENSLSKKLDKMLEDAKLDVQLFDRLRTGIDKFSNSVDQINQTVDVSASTHKYNDQLNKAAQHMESMNALYTMQLENGKKQSEYANKYVADMQKSAEQSEKFNQELQGLTSNLNNLNRVYGGMLTAMKS